MWLVVQAESAAGRQLLWLTGEPRRSLGYEGFKGYRKSRGSWIRKEISKTERESLLCQSPSQVWDRLQGVQCLRESNFSRVVVAKEVAERGGRDGVSFVPQEV